jgi:hypothetical protein
MDKKKNFNLCVPCGYNLTLSLLMPYIYGAAANASIWQKGFNSVFKVLIEYMQCPFWVSSFYNNNNIQ